MKRIMILAVAVFLAGFQVGVGAAQSPTPSPFPAGTVAASPTPSPAVPSPTPTPSGPTFQGRPCGVGTLINDFLIVHEPPPGPKATCLQQMTGAGPDKLYRMKTVPEGLQLRGIERYPASLGLIRIDYVSVKDPGLGVKIELDRYFNLPDPLILRDVSIATAANYLPVPGVALDDGMAVRTALWHETAGKYVIYIDPGATSLTLEEAAALLEPFDPGVAPPATGSGEPQASARTNWELPVGAGLLALSMSGSVYWWLRTRRRTR